MSTAAPPKPHLRSRTATTTAAVALSWAVAAAVYLVEVIKPDVIGVEEVVIAVTLAGSATLVRTAQYIVGYVTTQIAEQHARCQADTAAYVHSLRGDFDQVCLRVDAMGRQLQEAMAARIAEEHQTTQAETARAVIKGVETLRNIPVLTQQDIAAVAGGNVRHLNGSRQLG